MKHVTVRTTGTAIVGEVYVGTTHFTIADAISYVNAQGGGSIFIEAGTYNITAPIYLHSNIEVYGEGRHTVLLNAVPNTSTNAVFYIAGTSASVKVNIHIHDLFIGHASTSSGGYGIYGLYCGEGQSTGTASGLTRYVSGTVGTALPQYAGVRIEDCVFQWNRNGAIYLNHPSHNCTISGNEILDGGGNGCQVSGFNNTFSDNTVQRVAIYGLATSSSYNLIASGNQFSNCGSTGIVLSNNEGLVVSGNISQNNTANGLTQNGVYRSAITGNIIQNNATAGISQSQSEGITVSGNVVQGNRVVGGETGNTGSNSVWSGNTFQHNGGHGLSINGGTVIGVTGNTFTGNATYGAYCTASAGVSGNVAVGNGYVGLYNLPAMSGANQTTS